jgi:hypothetical protein
MTGRRHKVNKKRGCGKKTPRTGYFGGEDWEGGGQPYKPIYVYVRSRGSSVSTVSGYGLDYRAVDVRFPVEVRDFFL